MSEPDEPIVTTVTRQQARSGVGYAAPEILHETKKRRIVLQPWYIPHNTQPDGLAAKLVVQRAGLMGAWVDEHEVNLNEQAVSRLARALHEQRAVAATGEPGEFVLIRSGRWTAVSDADPADLVGAMVNLLQRPDVLDRFAQEDLG